MNMSLDDVGIKCLENRVQIFSGMNIEADRTGKIKREDVQVLPIFEYLAEEGNITERDMFNTFNMGVGMICVIDVEDAYEAINALKEAGEDAYILGEIVEGDEGVILW